MASRFEVTILGSSSATPTSKRFPSAQLLNVSERFFLIDCGEGAQIQLRRCNVKFQRINHIFISHLHGDHYLGLMGLVCSLHLLGRQKKLTIYSPKGLREVIEMQFAVSATVINYEIEWVVLNCEQPAMIYEDSQITVTTVILHHRIPCCGFIFREKEKPLTLIKEMLAEKGIPISAYHQLKRGENFVLDSGEVIKSRDVTREREHARSYAYCSDTRYNEGVIEAVKGVDLLYHEATFLHELLDRAEKTAHTTAMEAGMVASKAQVGKLLIGHYSVRYNDPKPLLDEAKTQFSNTSLADEGVTFKVGE